MDHGGSCALFQSLICIENCQKSDIFLMLLLESLSVAMERVEAVPKNWCLEVVLLCCIKTKDYPLIPADKHVQSSVGRTETVSAQGCQEARGAS